MKFETQWTQDEPELTAEKQKILDQELDHLNEMLDSAGDLIFHTIFLEESPNGATIAVDGIDDTLYLTYYEKTKWVPLTFEMDEEDESS